MESLPPDEPADVMVGPSRHLPWPLDTVARRSWDEASLQYKRFRHVLPVPIAQRLSWSVERLQRPRLEAYRARADEPSSVFVATNDPSLRASLFQAFGSSTMERASSVEKSALVPESRFDAGTVALEIPTRAARAFSRAGWLVLPRWVAMEVHLGDPEQSLWDARKREVIRQIQRSGLELEIARGSEAAEDFYRSLYVPTARARHGPRAIVVRQGHVEAAARSGCVLFVRDGSSRRAGLLVVPRPGRDRVVDALMFGVAQGSYATTKLAREAAYLFALRWARDTFRASRFGLTAAAPFVRDGILRFKRRWGATAVADLRQPTCIAVRVQSGSTELVRALGERPPIVLRMRENAATLCALSVQEAGTRNPRFPRTPGVDLAELEVQGPPELPALIDRWARGA